MIVETDRLLLREFDEGDAADYYALGSDPEVVRYIGISPFTRLEQALEVLRATALSDYRKHGFGRWACILKASSEFIGFAGLKRLDDLGEVDVGFWLLPTFWGRGFATEAGRAALNYGFDVLKRERIIGLVDPANLASVRVLQKLGMTCAGSIEYKGGEALKYFIQRGQRLPPQY
jgi:RimJ/RimL family protein N-acetyltransferase